MSPRKYELRSAIGGLLLDHIEIIIMLQEEKGGLKYIVHLLQARFSTLIISFNPCSHSVGSVMAPILQM